MPGDAYRALVMSKCPVAYWRLGEATGATEARDETGRHPGRYLGTSPVEHTDGVVAGNGAIRFDGSNYLEVCNSPDFSQPTHHPYGMTVEAWMRPDDVDFPADPARPYVHWMGKGRTNEEEWALRLYRESVQDRPNRTSGYLFRPRKLPEQDRNKGAGAYFEGALTPGAWIHVVVCYQPGDCLTTVDPREDPADQVAYIPGVEIYKNGDPMKGPPSPGTLYSNREYWVEPAHGSQPVRIGARDLGTGYPYFIGAIDEVAIYARLLTAWEVKVHFDAAQEPRDG